MKTKFVLVLFTLCLMTSVVLGNPSSMPMKTYKPSIGSAGNAYQLSMSGRQPQQDNWKPRYGMSAGNAYQLSMQAHQTPQANFSPRYGMSAGNASQVSMVGHQAQPQAATEPGTDDATQAMLRVNYCVFGGPNVDIYLNGEVAVINGRAQTNMPPLAVWGFWHLEPGTYSVAVVPDPAFRGFDRAFMPPVDVALEAGHRYTLVVLGQVDEPSHEALLIDETKAYQAIGATPTDNAHITINNLRGIAGITWTLVGEVREDDIPYGEFQAATWPKGPFTGFETTFRHAGNDELDSGAIDEEFWLWPGVQWQDCFGGAPSKASFFETEGVDWLNRTSNYASTLSAPELLREVGSTEGSPYSFDTFLSAVEAAGLSEALTTGGPYVMYVPTDEAFTALPQAERDALMADPKDLADVARYHISEGYYPSGSFRNPDNPRRIDLTNLLGMDLARLADGTINGVAVPQAEVVFVRNGTRVIVIGQVLRPPER